MNRPAVIFLMLILPKWSGGSGCLGIHEKSPTNSSIGARALLRESRVDRFGVERCVAVSPIVADAPMVGEATARVLEEEATRLRAQGIAVSMLLPTDLEADAFGFDLLDLTKVDAAIEAGLVRGRLEADRLRAPRG